MSNPIQSVEGVVHSYKQHDRTIRDVSTSRSENPRGKTVLEIVVEYDGLRPDWPVVDRRTKEHMSRARLLKRLFGTDGIWVNKVASGAHNDVYTVVER